MKIELEQLQARVFGIEFNQYIRTAFDKMVASGEFGEEERDYGVAMAFFRESMSKERYGLLTELERLQQEKLAYASKYSFLCGITAAYEQFFSKTQQFSFETTLEEGLFMVDGMKQHHEYEALTTQVRKGYDGLEQELDEKDCEHLTSHECAWDERIHYATISGYYFGYRTGLSILDSIYPLSTEKMMDKVLLTEYKLGITLPQLYRERIQRKKGA